MSKGSRSMPWASNMPATRMAKARAKKKLLKVAMRRGKSELCDESAMMLKEQVVGAISMMTDRQAAISDERTLAILEGRAVALERQSVMPDANVQHAYMRQEEVYQLRQAARWSARLWAGEDACTVRRVQAAPAAFRGRGSDIDKESLSHTINYVTYSSPIGNVQRISPFSTCSDIVA
jgi:hypothetical protein